MATKIGIFIFFLSLLSLAAQEILQTCPKCNFVEKREFASYCIHCGTRLVKMQSIEVSVCTKCRRPLDRGAKYCAFCGGEGKIDHQSIPTQEYSPNKETPSPAEPTKPLPAEKYNLRAYAYPKAKLLEQYVVDEGLRHTSRARQIERFFYSTQATCEEVEKYYASIWQNVALTRFVDDLLQTPGVILKWENPEMKESFEIIFYSFLEADKRVWDGREKKINARFDLEKKPLFSLDKEIAALRNKVAQGALSADKAESNIEALERQKKATTNTRTYYQLLARTQVVSLHCGIIVMNWIRAK